MKVLKILILLAIIVFFVAVSLGSSLEESLTYDEIVHIQDGYFSLIDHTFNIDPYNPPLSKELFTIPILFLNPFLSTQPNIRLLPARLVSILFGVIILIGVFYFHRKNYSAGIVSMVLLIADPTFLASSHLVTPDMPTTLFLISSYFSVLLLTMKFSNTLLSISGVFIGLTLGTRISTLPLCILFFTILFIMYVYRRNTIVNLQKLFVRSIVMISIIFIVLWSSYFFTVQPILVYTNNTRRVSAKVLQWAKNHNVSFVPVTISFLQNTSLPLGNYISVIKNNILRSQNNDATYFLGKYFENIQWYMLPINYLLKTSIPLLLIVAMSIKYLLKHDKNRLIVLGLPITGIILFSVVAKIQPLVRYLLPISPFVVLLGGESVRWATSSLKKGLLIILLFLNFVDVMKYYPHFLTYTNQFSQYTAPTKVLFTDSNVDWGQGLITLSKFIQKNKPNLLVFSYFGRDDATLYGFNSNLYFGSWKSEDICKLHSIKYSQNESVRMTVISISNWYNCGFNLQETFNKKNIKEIVGGSFLVF